MLRGQPKKIKANLHVWELKRQIKARDVRETDTGKLQDVASRNLAGICGKWKPRSHSPA